MSNFENKVGRANVWLDDEFELDVFLRENRFNIICALADYIKVVAVEQRYLGIIGRTTTRVANHQHDAHLFFMPDLLRLQLRFEFGLSSQLAQLGHDDSAPPLEKPDKHVTVREALQRFSLHLPAVRLFCVLADLFNGIDGFQQPGQPIINTLAGKINPQFARNGAELLEDAQRDGEMGIGRAWLLGQHTTILGDILHCVHSEKAMELVVNLPGFLSIFEGARFFKRLDSLRQLLQGFCLIILLCHKRDKVLEDLLRWRRRGVIADLVEGGSRNPFRNQYIGILQQVSLIDIEKMGQCARCFLSYPLGFFVLSVGEQQLKNLVPGFLIGSVDQAVQRSEYGSPDESIGIAGEADHILNTGIGIVSEKNEQVFDQC